MIQIRCRFTAKILFECEAGSMKIAVEKAVAAKANLSSANLRSANLNSADLRSANLNSADLRFADLRYADLRYADLTSADLRSADLTSANLRSANLNSADLRFANLNSADLRYADLTSADLRSADLTSANLSSANLRYVKEDFIKKLLCLKEEAPGLYKHLIDGKIDGSCYQGECACFCGTLANQKGIHVDELESFGIILDGYSPVEVWFSAIRKGDTPESNSVSAVTKVWLEEFMSEHKMAIPTRTISWD